MRHLLCLLLLSAITFASCSAGYSATYAVHVDSAFTPLERLQIATSLYEWEIRTGARLRPIDVIDARVAWGPRPFNEDLFLVVAKGNHCPLGKTLDGYIGLHYRAFDSQMECFDMVWLRAHSEYFPRTVLHETGHALGLRFPGRDAVHETSPKVPSVMHPVVSDDTEHVTCTDVASFCQEFGTCNLSRKDCL